MTTTLEGKLCLKKLTIHACWSIQYREILRKSENLHESYVNDVSSLTGPYDPVRDIFGGTRAGGVHMGCLHFAIVSNERGLEGIWNAFVLQ